MVPNVQNPYGFPTRNQHVSLPACGALLKAAGTEAKLSIFIATIDRVSQTPIISRPADPPAVPEPAAACLAYYKSLAESGRAVEIRKVAALSSYFRRHYAAAVKWAKSQPTQTPAKP